MCMWNYSLCYTWVFMWKGDLGKTVLFMRLLNTVVVNTLLCSARYQHDRERPADSAANMKRLLSHLRNLPLKRKIATDLGLSDVLLSLSPTQDEGFLHDVARL